MFFKDFWEINEVYKNFYMILKTIQQINTLYYINFICLEIYIEIEIHMIF